ncbi:MAG: alpha/beta hydrolase [Candidatus Dormibacteria bacterium]
MKRFTRIAALFSVLLAAACSAGPLSGVLAPTREGCVDTKQAQDVHLITSDQVAIYGASMGKGKVGILFGHQRGSNLCSWWPFAQKMAGLGYRVLAIDFRGQGVSAAGPKGAEFALDKDLDAGAAYLRRQGSDRLVVVGASMGGTAAVVVAAGLPDQVYAVASLSGPKTFMGLAADAAAPGLNIPALYMASRDDHPYVDEGGALANLTMQSNRTFDILPGSDHGTDMLVHAQGAAATAILEGFIRQHVPV